MPEAIGSMVAEFGRHASPGSWFLAKDSEIEEQRELIPYSHYLRLAWTELDLSGVLCVDGRPAVYLCEATHFTPDQKRDRHRFAWNQGLVPLLIFVTPNQVEVHSTVKMPAREPEGGGLFESSLTSLIPNLGNIAEALEIARFVRSVETGQFFQDNAEFFPSGQDGGPLSFEKSCAHRTQPQSYRLGFAACPRVAGSCLVRKFPR